MNVRFVQTQVVNDDLRKSEPEVKKLVLKKWRTSKRKITKER